MKDRLISLFEKFLGDELTEAELEELRKLAQQSDSDGLDEAMQALFMDAPLQFSDREGNRERVFQAVSKHIDNGERPVKRLWPRYAAAAAILLCIITGGWFFMQHNKEQQHKNIHGEIAASRSLTPANATAWLTLADGRRVPLNGANTASAAMADSNASWKKLQRGGLLDYQNASPGEDTAFNTLTTSRGIQYQLILPDGSHVWLNSASAIRYPTVFGKDKRTVELDGEAYFEIAKNASAPFYVKTGKQEVQVLGTGFNVMAYNDEPALRTTLFEGSIKVNANAAVVLKPGEQSVLPLNGVLSVQAANLEEVAAWRNGAFIFKRRTIEEIMRQICRWYDVEVEYRGPLPTAQFTGNLSRQDEAFQLLEILQETNNVHFQREGKKIIVMQ